MKKITAQLFALFITWNTFAQTAGANPESIAIGTKVLITEIASKDFYFDNREDFINKNGTVNYTLVIDKNGFYKGRIDCENGKSYNFTKIKVVIQKEETASSATGFDAYYENLMKGKNDTSKSLIDNPKGTQSNSSASIPATSTYLSKFNFDRFEQQILALTADPRDGFKGIITEENAGNSNSAATFYNTSMVLEGIPYSKVVHYISSANVSGNLRFIATSSSYLSKAEATEIVDNMIESIKKMKTLKYKYTISEPYNVATRRLVSITFSDPKKDITLSMDIDMGTSNDSNTNWEIEVRVNKYPF